MTWRLALLLVVVALASCQKQQGQKQQVEETGRPRYELVCDSSDTREFSALFCIWHDTSTGDTKRVDVDSLPKSQGATKGQAQPAGCYHLVCDATASEKRSDFYCIRLNVETGEMLLVDLPKIGLIPEKQD